MSTPHRLYPAELIAHSTLRIVCVLPDGSESTGTGFFYSFARDGDRFVPTIVINKHVVEQAVSGRFHLTLQGPDGLPDTGKHEAVNVEQFEQRWIPHPDAAVDLCAMPIAPLVNAANVAGKKLFYVPLDDTLLPTTADLTELSALEDILMVGYPNGIWDAVNNMPIFRRGITATHPNIDYEGRREFLIDAACFPGSSGSPVFLFNTSSWTNRKGNVMMGSPRVKLLGVLYAGPQHTATGDVRIVNVPTTQRVVSVSTIPNNLGLVIKAARLVEFEPLMRALVAGMPI